MTFRWLTYLSIKAMRRLGPKTLVKLGERRALAVFRRAARVSPAYRTLLAEAGVDPTAISSTEDFRRRVPIMDKRQTFGRFPLHELCTMPISPLTVQNVITSSGQGELFAFGILSRSQAKATTRMIDIALDLTYQTMSRRTFLVNCLPMGVGFHAETVSIAETSVREDMVVALIRAFSPYYDQVIVVCDPLFLKRLVDYAKEKALDWRQCPVHFIIGEETISESFRNYIGSLTGIDLDNPAHGLIASTMGLGELAMNLFFETRRSIALRRLAYQDPAVFRLLFGETVSPMAMPMIFVFNPLRTFVETLPDDITNPFGQLVITLTDPGHPVPLPRYDTGDRARLIEPDLIEALARMGYQLPEDEVGLPMLALIGRDKDKLPGGLHVAQFKEAIFRDPQLAAALSGAFTLTNEQDGLRLHLQMRKGLDDLPPEQAACLPGILPPGFDADKVSVWKYREFPFAMTLDYERKLNYVA